MAFRDAISSLMEAVISCKAWEKWWVRMMRREDGVGGGDEVMGFSTTGVSGS